MKKKKPKTRGKPSQAKLPIDSQQRLLNLFNKFEQSAEQTFGFPKTLSSEERFFLHSYCHRNGYNSKSKGKGSNRQLFVTKPSSSLGNIKNIGIPKKVFTKMHDYFLENPFTLKEKKYLSLHASDPEIHFSHLTQKKFNHHHLMHPQRSRVNDTNNLGEAVNAFNNLNPENSLTESRQKLPIYAKKDEILSKVGKVNVNVTILTGETGCGKSTQVPQFLLENYFTNTCEDPGKTCRVIVTQPRRISAISLAERVATEMGENSAGGLVGYSVRLESKQSKATRILYCTTGTLLRSISLSHSSNMLTSATHLVLDEVHERDSNCDFLLAIVRDMLSQRQENGIGGEFHVILMSATLQASKFAAYFKEKQFECEHVHVKGSLHPITVHYLESILGKTNFMENLKNSSASFDAQISQQEEALSQKQQDNLGEKLEIKDTPGSSSTHSCGGCAMTFHDLSSFIAHAALCRAERISENESICRSSGDEVSKEDEGEKLTIENEMKLYQFSRRMRKLANSRLPDLDLIVSILELIHRANDNIESISGGGTVLRFADAAHVNEPRSNLGKGAVLVFLSGWAEISALMELLEDHPVFGNPEKSVVYPLHSAIDTASQRKVFSRTENGIRKIVLSTNIAETSVTIDDVLYVVDSVTSKQLSHDPSTSMTTLAAAFIDKASSTQRAGRAGRVRSGICFRLVSKEDFDELEDEAVPELLRMSLEEICLQLASMHIPSLTSKRKDWINDFLKNCIDSPPPKTVSNAVDLLQKLNALTISEELTSLGRILAHLPLHPSLGRMLLMSRDLQCFDQALTFCAFETAARDAFFMTPDMSVRERQDKARHELCGKLPSDHAVGIALWDRWSNPQALSKGAMCKQFGVSFTFMNTAGKIRRQIVDQMNALRLISRSPPPSVPHPSSSQVEFMVSMGHCERLAVKMGKQRVFGNLVEKSLLPIRSSCIGKQPEEYVHGKASGGNKKKGNTCQVIGFSEFIKTDKACLIKNCTRLSMLSVILFSLPLRIQACYDSEAMDSSSDGKDGWDSSSSSSLDVNDILNETEQNVQSFGNYSETEEMIEAMSKDFMNKFNLKNNKQLRGRKGKKQSNKSKSESVVLGFGGFLEIKCPKDVAEQFLILRSRMESLMSESCDKFENNVKSREVADLVCDMMKAVAFAKLSRSNDTSRLAQQSHAPRFRNPIVPDSMKQAQSLIDQEQRLRKKQLAAKNKKLKKQKEKKSITSGLVPSQVFVQSSKKKKKKRKPKTKLEKNQPKSAPIAVNE